MRDHLVCYQDSPLRKDWENPTEQDIAQSLRKAHAVNKQLVSTVNELYDDKNTLKKELKDVKEELKTSRTKERILTSILSSSITSAILALIFTVARVFVFGHKP